MFKSLVVLAVSSMMATTAVAQAQQPPTPALAKPQTVKKRVCFAAESDSYSRLGERKICKTVEVPAETASSNGGQSNQTAPASSGSSGNKN